MILINLLPHREEARKRRRESFYVALGISALVGGLVGGAIFLWYASQISNQQARNLVLQTEIKRLDGQIKDITNLQSEIAALRARQQAVEDLQADRNMPVHLLNELVRQLPDGVYITSLRQDGQSVTLTGVAQSNERVSELLRRLSSGSSWLTRPELIEIVSGNVALSARDQRRVSNFTMRVRLMRASEAAKAASAAAKGAASAAAAAAPTPTPAPAASASGPAASRPASAASPAAAPASGAGSAPAPQTPAASAVPRK